MFRCLLAANDGFLTVQHDPELKKLTVLIDRSLIKTHGRPAIAKLLLQLHIYRCTADVEGCRAFYSALTDPDERLLEWRVTMLANEPAKQIFVQGNTFKDGDDVSLSDYDTTVEGVIRSWAERKVIS